MPSLWWRSSTSAVLISIKDVYKSYELYSGHTMQSDDGIWMRACFPLRFSQQEEQSFYSARLGSVLVSCIKDFRIFKQAMKPSKLRCFIAFFLIENQIVNCEHLRTHSTCAIWPYQPNKAGVLCWQYVVNMTYFQDKLWFSGQPDADMDPCLNALA